MTRKKNQKKSTRIDLRGEILEEMKNVGYRVPNKDTRFVSIEYLKDLFSRPKSLRQSLGQDIRTFGNINFTGQELDELEAYVLSKATKLYAVLLLLEESHLIIAVFKSDHPLDDKIFEKFQNGVGPFCPQNSLHETPLSDQAHAIYEWQWYIPPVLTHENHQTYPVREFRFPFVEMPSGFRSGSWGLVSTVKIANGHMKADAYNPGDYVAHKTVQKPYKTNRDSLLKEVNTLRSRKHENIVPLLASFSAGCVDPETANPTEEWFHMFFPLATKGTMKGWLDSETPPDPSLALDEQRHTFVYNAMQNLVSGLAHIHREIDVKTGFHHDLKPSNILFFTNGEEVVWKIADFGNANLKNPEEGTGTEYSRDNPFGTYMYRPPEYFIGRDAGDSSKHGRSFDIFSLGCIFLELATVYRYGWDDAGLPLFQQRRASNRTRPYNGPEYTIDDRSFHNNLDVVHKWIQGLEEDSYSNERLRKVLRLIRAMLTGRRQRIFAWELDMDLYELRHQCEPDSKLEARLRRLIQQSREPLNALDNQHNPLQWAIENKRPKWWIAILQENKWSCSKPTANEELTQKARNAERVKIHMSTLTSSPATQAFEDNRLFGRHELDNAISIGFQTSYCVALYGKSGIGKSHLAYRHTVRYRDAKKEKDRKHTFWVDATNLSNFLQSMNEIARKISLDILDTEETTLVHVKNWLTDVKGNGPWIMVLDGLNTDEVAKKAAKHLPKECGQILITTKNRALCAPFLRLNQKKQILPVGELEKEDRQAVFRWYMADELVAENDQYMDDLLTKISLPQSIKLLASYLTKYHIHALHIYNDLMAGRSDTIRNAVSELYKDLLSPLTPQNYGEDKIVSQLTDWPSQEMELLGVLSCLSHDSVQLDLVLKYDEDHSLRIMLGILENCALVGKGGNDSYFMSEFTQRAVRDWVEVNMGFNRLFALHETALRMLYQLYSEKKNRRGSLESSRTRRSSYSSKLKCMIHFDRFYDFARHTKGSIEYNIRDATTVKAIYTFSQVYLEEARYTAAIFILEFAQKRYTGHEYHYPLGRLLVQAYLARSGDFDLSKAEDLLEKLLGEAKAGKNELQICELTLEFARLYTKVGQPRTSLERLQAPRVLSLRLEGNQPLLVNQIQIGPNEHKEPQLAVGLKLEEARAHLAIAKSTKIPHESKLALDLAASAFHEARQAVNEWYPLDKQWLAEIDEEITDVLYEKGTLNALRKAEGILTSRLESIERACSMGQLPQSYKLIIDSRIARIQLALSGLTKDGELRNRALAALEQLLGKYEELYGRSHIHYTRCKRWLDSASQPAFHRHDIDVRPHNEPKQTHMLQWLLWPWVAIMFPFIFLLYFHLA